MSEAKGNNTTGKSGDTNTSTSNNKRGSGSVESGANGSTGSTDSGKQVEKNVKSNLVNQDKPKTFEVKIEAEEKADQKETPKKKAPAKKKTKSNTDQVKDIQSLLEGVFMVASLKAGDHWSLTSDESKQIAVPLSNILERYDLLGKASEVSDPVALVVAIMTITVPRVMVSKMTMEQKKKETLMKNGVINNDRKQERSFSGDSGSNAGTTKTTNQSNDGQFIKSIHNQIQEGI